MGLSIRLPLLSVLVILTFAVLVSVILILEGRGTLTSVEYEHLALSARSYAAAVQFYIQNAKDELDTAAQIIAPAIRANGLDAHALEQVQGALTAASANSTVLDFIELAGIDGTIALIEPQTLEQKLYTRTIGYRRWFQDAVRTRTSVVSNLFITVPTRLPAVAVAVPILDNRGNAVAVLEGAIRLGQLSQAGALQEDGRRAGRYGFLTDGHGLVIAHQVTPRFVAEQTDFNAEPTVQRALQGDQGTLTFFDPVEKTWMLGAYLPFPPAGAVGGRVWTVSFVVPQDVALAPIGVFSRTIAALAGVFALVFAAFSFLFTRRLMSPLDQLTLAVQKAGMGDFSYRITEVRGEEFARLSRAYNDMAGQLGQKDRTIQEHQDQLRQTNARLEEANKELEAFSYSVSHDLRAPLRAIDDFSHALQEDLGDGLGADGKQYIDRIRNAVRTMGALIEDMLKLSRVSRADLVREPVDVGAIARHLVGEISAGAPERKADFVIPPRIPALADPRLLEILLGNLLDNAWKFTRTRQPARIEVGQQETDGLTAFYVRDNGVGFDMKYVNKLFGAFQRLHSKEEYEGTGIGLVIVRRIAARHGGRAWAESVVGEGSTFYFTLSGKEDRLEQQLRASGGGQSG